MNEELNRLITKIQNEKNNILRNEIIEKYTPFIIKTASKVLGKYIEVENDEELSIVMNQLINIVKKKDLLFLFLH